MKIRLFFRVKAASLFAFAPYAFGLVEDPGMPGAT
jgi:hypothetical protein